MLVYNNIKIKFKEFIMKDAFTTYLPNNKIKDLFDKGLPVVIDSNKHVFKYNGYRIDAIKDDIFGLRLLLEKPNYSEGGYSYLWELVFNEDLGRITVC